MGFDEQPETLGRYILTHHLATGGMAEVWLAKEQGIAGFERVVVVKKILPSLGEAEEFRSMFVDEARIAARLNHANIIQIYDLGRQEGIYYIAMQHVLGENLSTLTRLAGAAGGSVPPEIAAWIIGQAARGLHHAHQRKRPDGSPMNIVHRDISPQNVMCSYEGEVVVLDFGIAKARDRLAKTQDGMVKGKARYMSPEQLLSGDLDHRTDIFSLGVTLWEMLAGQKMISGDSDAEVLAKLVRYEPSPPSAVQPGVPAALDAIVMKATAREAEDRYADGLAFRRALDGYIRDCGQVVDEAEVASFLSRVGSEELATKQRLVQEAASTKLVRQQKKRVRTENLLEEEGEAVAPASPSVPEISDSAATLAVGAPAMGLEDILAAEAAEAEDLGVQDTLLARDYDPSVLLGEDSAVETIRGAEAIRDASDLEDHERSTVPQRRLPVPERATAPPSASPPTRPAPPPAAVAAPDPVASDPVEEEAPPRGARLGGVFGSKWMLIAGGSMTIAAALIILIFMLGQERPTVEALPSEAPAVEAAAPAAPVAPAEDPPSEPAPTAGAGVNPDASVTAPTAETRGAGAPRRARSRRRRARSRRPGKVTVRVKLPPKVTTIGGIHVDGNPVGPPPVTTDLPPGEHTIEVRSGSKIRLAKKLNVKPGGQHTVVFDGQDLMGLIKVLAKGRDGRLIPGAKIRIDGAAVESRTPATLQVMEGTHRVEALVGGKWVTYTARVRPGHLTKVLLRPR